MKRHKEELQEIEAKLALFDALPEEELARAEERAFRRLLSERDRVTSAPAEPSIRPRWIWRWTLAAMALGLVIATQIPALRTLFTGIDAHAVVESAEGGLYRISGGEALSRGQSIEAGQPVRTNGAAGAVLRLADGSRIEVRSQSELSLEPADDGVQVYLDKGSVIVNAAKQRPGRHLYVRTKHMNLSVVGTVFFVNAEAEGSRVAVIEGEVRVQQGTTQKKLLTGEQVTTSPKMAARPVQEEIAWSRHAEAHVAALREQSLAQTSAAERVAFEEASIRPKPPAPAGGRGGPAPGGPFWGCGGRVQYDPSLFSFQNATVYALITWAYGPDSCSLVNMHGRISGGPDWIKSDLFDVQAVIPAGASNAISPDRLSSDRSGLTRPATVQLMLRTLLAERFNLVIRRQTRSVPVYELTIAKSGSKLRRSTDASCVAPENVSMERGSACGASLVNITEPNQAVMRTFKMGLDEFSKILIVALDRPVINKTELAGGYDIVLEFAPDRGALATFPVGGAMAITGPIGVRTAPLPVSGSSIFTALQEQLGLKLEPAVGSFDFLVIDRVERPSQN